MMKIDDADKPETGEMRVASDSPGTVWVTKLSRNRIERWSLETGAH